MATRVVWANLIDTIKMADPENPIARQESGAYLLHKLSYSRFMLKIANFRCPGNKGMYEPNVTGIVELADPENHIIEPKITILCYIQPKLWQIFG